MDKTRVLLIGRHAPIGLEKHVEIVEQRNIQFPALVVECIETLQGLLADAERVSAAVLLQAVPGQVAIALARMARMGVTLPVGVVISRPSPREAGKTQVFWGDGVGEAVKFSNPNAKVEGGAERWEVTVDPPMKFEFDHIEWL